MSEGARFAFPRAELRSRTVRGALVTGAFLVGIDALVVAQGLIVTALLGPELIGLYGIVAVTVTTVTALKRVGIDEAFVQQEDGGEEAFARAFTLELALSAAFTVALCVLAPVVALAYDEERLLGLMLAMAWLPLAMALQAPLWVFFRRMEYARQRALQAVQPLVTFCVTVPLAAATDLGAYALVVGLAAGYAVAVVAALALSPFRLRLRFDRAAARRYVAFSSWILVATVATLVMQQGQVFAFDAAEGLEWAGFLTLAVTVTRYVDRADQVVTSTVFPAIAAIQGRTATLTELFVKTNRATLLWVAPFSAGIVLYAPDLVALLGEEWEPAALLVQGLAVVGLLQHVGFNWFAFYRAHGDTRPPAVEAVVRTLAFHALAIPGLLMWEDEGFVVGAVLAVCVALGVRFAYVRRMLPGVAWRSVLAPSVVAATAAVASALAVRGLLWGGDREAWQVVVEVALFVSVFGSIALRRERALLVELRVALRPGEQRPGEHGGDERERGDLPVPVDR